MFINFAHRRFAGHLAAVTAARLKEAVTNRWGLVRGVGAGLQVRVGESVCVWACTGPIKRALTSTGLNKLLNDGDGTRLSSAAARHLAGAAQRSPPAPAEGRALQTYSVFQFREHVIIKLCSGGFTNDIPVEKTWGTGK